MSSCQNDRTWRWEAGASAARWGRNLQIDMAHVIPRADALALGAVGACTIGIAEERTTHTVRLREMETRLMETILEFASVSLRTMETLLLESWWP